MALTRNAVDCHSSQRINATCGKKALFILKIPYSDFRSASEIARYHPISRTRIVARDEKALKVANFTAPRTDNEVARDIHTSASVGLCGGGACKEEHCKY